MAVSVPRWLPLVLIALAALWLRTHDLSRRAMHADEANQAVKTGQLLETGYYAFDPRDHHGPTLYYAALPIAWIRGEFSLNTLTETSVRLVPAIMGTIGVVLLGWLATPFGRWPASAAAAFMAVAPPAVYYSRYFIQETLLVTFTLSAMLCAQHWWRRGQLAWALGTGACLGLMQATKASAPLFIVAAAIALIAFRPFRPVSPHPLRALSAAVLAGLAVAALFYSSFGSHLSGLRDAVSVYGPAADRATGESGHEKPWWYYLQLFAWQREGGLVWQQVAFSSAVLIGLITAFAHRSKFLLRVALYTGLIAVALSLTPYKTPWHSVHLVPGFSILAASALTLIPRVWLSVPLVVVVLYFQLTQTQLIAFLRPHDVRNPYAYVHSSPDVTRVRTLAEAALQRSPDGVIKIISEEYWPLPWYLRGLSSIGYWDAPPADCDAALVVASVEHADVVRARLTGTYRESYLGLRPGFLLVVFTSTP